MIRRIRGSFLEKTVDRRKHLGEARGLKECPREREIMNTVLKEKRGEMKLRWPFLG